MLYAQGSTTEAIETLKKALEIDPSNANALNSLGFIYGEESLDFPRGIQMCRQAVELNPRNPAYLDSLGWVLYRAGDLAEAKASLRRALDLAPGNRGNRRAPARSDGCPEEGQRALVHAPRAPPWTA